MIVLLFGWFLSSYGCNAPQKPHILHLIKNPKSPSFENGQNQPGTNASSAPSKKSFIPKGKSHNQNKQQAHCAERALPLFRQHRLLFPGRIKHRKQNKPKVQTKCHRLPFCSGHNATRAGCLGPRSHRCGAATQPPQGHGRVRTRRRGLRKRRGGRGSGAGRKSRV